jgi:hypothetical protein
VLASNVVLEDQDTDCQTPVGPTKWDQSKEISKESAWRFACVSLRIHLDIHVAKCCKMLHVCKEHSITLYRSNRTNIAEIKSIERVNIFGVQIVFWLRVNLRLSVSPFSESILTTCMEVLEHQCTSWYEYKDWKALCHVTQYGITFEYIW